MCGITGALWNTPQKSLDGATLQRMVESLRHRGPDDEGDWRSEFRLLEANEVRPGVALGFRRLSIIDLAGGHHPMSNEDGSVWMVFNGEIYNYLELRRRLEGSGHQFRSRSDSEAIVHLYEDLGVECFSHLNGMFAICTPYDKEKATPGNGAMVAFNMESRANVDKLHAKALSLGASDEGAPGERGPGFYGAYFRDADGNKFCGFCMG